MDGAQKTPLSQEFRKFLDKRVGILGVQAKTGILHPIEQGVFKAHTALNITRAIVAMTVFRGRLIFTKLISLRIYVRAGILSNIAVRNGIADNHNDANVGA